MEFVPDMGDIDWSAELAFQVTERLGGASRTMMQIDNNLGQNIRLYTDKVVYDFGLPTETTVAKPTWQSNLDALEVGDSTIWFFLVQMERLVEDTPTGPWGVNGIIGGPGDNLFTDLPAPMNFSSPITIRLGELDDNLTDWYTIPKFELEAEQPDPLISYFNYEWNFAINFPTASGEPPNFRTGTNGLAVIYPRRGAAWCSDEPAPVSTACPAFNREHYEVDYVPREEDTTWTAELAFSVTDRLEGRNRTLIQLGNILTVYTGGIVKHPGTGLAEWVAYPSWQTPLDALDVGDSYITSVYIVMTSNGGTSYTINTLLAGDGDNVISNFGGSLTRNANFNVKFGELNGQSDWMTPLKVEMEGEVTGGETVFYYEWNMGPYIYPAPSGVAPSYANGDATAVPGGLVVVGDAVICSEEVEGVDDENDEGDDSDSNGIVPSFILAVILTLLALVQQH